MDGFNSLSVSALNKGMIKSTNFALSGGLIAGVQGVVTQAYDDSSVKSAVYGTIDTGSTSGVVNITAQSAPELYSSCLWCHGGSGWLHGWLFCLRGYRNKSGSGSW